MRHNERATGLRQAQADGGLDLTGFGNLLGLCFFKLQQYLSLFSLTAYNRQ